MVSSKKKLQIWLEVLKKVQQSRSMNRNSIPVNGFKWIVCG